MNLHTSLQYPFLKYIVEEFSGSFYENDLTSLHRILILYHNRYSFSIHVSSISKFLDDHQQSLSESDWLHWYFFKAKRRKIRQVRMRTALVLKFNRTLIEELLLRKDYSAPEAVQQTLQKILQWLETEPTEIVGDDQIDLSNWKSELSFVIDHLSEDNHKRKPSRTPAESRHFFEILVGINQAEKRNRFNQLSGLLVEHKWAAPTQTANVYQFHKQRKGGRLYIGALYYVLNEMGYVSKALDGPQIAALFDSFLLHNFEQGSFIKVFQPEEQAQFNCGPNDQRYKYVSEARLLLKDF